MKRMNLILVVIALALLPIALFAQATLYPKGILPDFTKDKIKQLKKELDVTSPNWNDIIKMYFDEIYDSQLPDLIIYINKGNIAKQALLKEGKEVQELFGEQFIWVLFISDKNIPDTDNADLIKEVSKTIKTHIAGIENIQLPTDKQAENDIKKAIESIKTLCNDILLQINYLNKMTIDYANGAETSNQFAEDIKKAIKSMLEDLTVNSVKQDKLKESIDNHVKSIKELVNKAAGTEKEKSDSTDKTAKSEISQKACGCKNTTTETKSEEKKSTTGTVDLNVLSYQSSPTEITVRGVIKILSSLIFGSSISDPSSDKELKDTIKSLKLTKHGEGNDVMFTWMSKFKVNINTKNRLVVRPPDDDKKYGFQAISYNFGNYDASYVGITLGLGIPLVDTCTTFKNTVDLYVFANLYLKRPTLPTDSFSLSLAIGTNFITTKLFSNIIAGFRVGLSSPVGFVFGAQFSAKSETVTKVWPFIGFDYKL